MDKIRKNLPPSGAENSGIEKKKEGELLDEIGSVLDIGFPADKMPKVLNALIIKEQNSFEDYTYVICEVQHILENNRVLALALLSKGHLKKGMKVLDTGAPLSALRGREERFEGFTMYIDEIRNPYSFCYEKAVTPMERSLTVVLLLVNFFIILFGGLR